MIRLVKILSSALVVTTLGMIGGCTGSSHSGKQGWQKGIPVLAMVPASSGTTGSQASAMSAQVVAAQGGVLQFGDELTLSIPPDSLADDVTITIERATMPSQNLNGFQNPGQAYKLSPDGLEFDPSNPPVLSIKKSGASGLDTLMFYDPDSDEYVAGGSPPSSGGQVAAAIPHFSFWLIGTIAATPGPGPIIATNQPIMPATPRYNAPIYVRESVPNLNVAPIRSVAGIKVFKRRNAAGQVFTPVTAADGVTPITMIPEVQPSTPNFWGISIPPINFPTAPPPNVTYQLCFIVVDSLGNNQSNNPTGTSTCLNGRTRNITFNATRAYNGAALSVTPTGAPYQITAGFSSLFVLKSTDQGGTAFNMVPDITPTWVNSSGPQKNNVLNYGGAGALFVAGKSGSDTLTLAISGPHSGSVAIPINVTPGYVATMVVMDGTTPGLSVPIVSCASASSQKCLDGAGHFRIKEGQYFTFDVLGFDQFGNQIGDGTTQSVNPTLALTPSLGTLQTSGPTIGEISTLDASAGTGSFTATLGALTNTLPVDVVARSWQYLGGGLKASGYAWSGRSSITQLNGVLYAAIGSQQSPLFNSGDITLHKWTGSAWTSQQLIGSADVWEPQVSSDGTNINTVFQTRNAPGVMFYQRSSTLTHVSSGFINGSFSGMSQITDNSGNVWILTGTNSGAVQALVTKHNFVTFSGFQFLSNPLSTYAVNPDPTHSASTFMIAHDPVTDGIYVALTQYNASGDRDLHILKYNSGTDTFDIVGGGPVTTLPVGHATDGTKGSMMAFANGKIYVVFTEGNSQVISFGDVYVASQDMSSVSNPWVKNAVPANTGGTMASGGRGAGWANIYFNSHNVLYVNMVESSVIPANVQGRGLDTLVSKHWNGTTWISDGGDFTDSGASIGNAYGFSQMLLIGDTMYRYFNFCPNNFTSETCGSAQSFVQMYD